MDIAFVGKINQTNSIIEEVLLTHYDATISYYNIIELLNAYSEDVSTHPDLIFFDLNTHTGLGKAPANIQKITQYFPETPILVIHPYQFIKLIQPLIEAGAMGVISVTPSSQITIEAVNQLLDGNAYLPYPEADS